MAGLCGSLEKVGDVDAPQPGSIIFDFDGTLADSLYATLRVLYELIHREPLPPEDVSRLRGMTLVQVLRQLKIAPWRALFMKEKVHNAMRDRMDDVALIPGVDEMIKALSADYQLFIASSNDAANVQIFLQRFELKRYFTGVYGDANPLRKARLLRKVIAENSLDSKRTWYVGDQPWDMRAAHRAHVHAAAVAWGFSNLHVLKATRPEVLAFSPGELVEYVHAHEQNR